MNRRFGTLGILALIILATGAPVARAVAANGDGCTTSANGFFGRRMGVIVKGLCAPINAPRVGDTVTTYRTIGCTADGHEVVQGRVLAARCPGAVPRCVLLAEGGMSGTPFWAYLVQYRVGGGRWVSGEYWCPQTQGQAVAPDAATIRDQVIRLLPAVGIGTTDDHVSLVNIETLFWAVTAARRSLGTVLITGHRVWLRVVFDSAGWDFGDGAAETARTPGKVYDKVGEPCGTKVCPDYYGHVYRVAGPVTVRLRVSWQASWSLDGSHYLPVGSGPITGPQASYSLMVKQAKGVLVAGDR